MLFDMTQEPETRHDVCNGRKKKKSPTSGELRYTNARINRNARNTVL